MFIMMLWGCSILSTIVRDAVFMRSFALVTVQMESTQVYLLEPYLKQVATLANENGNLPGFMKVGLILTPFGRQDRRCGCLASSADTRPNRHM